MTLSYKTHSRLLVFLYRILLLYIFLFFARLIYLIANWHFFSNIDAVGLLSVFKGGLLFDSASIGYTMGVFILLTFVGAILPRRVEMSRAYRSLIKFFYIVPSILNISLNIGDAGYYPYILKRMTKDVFTEFAGDNLFKIVSNLAVTFWVYTLLIILASVLLIFLYNRVSFDRRNVRLSSLQYIVSTTINLVILVCLGFLSIFAIKGGTNLFNVPMTPMKAAEFCDRAEHRAVVLNTTYCMLRTSGKPVLQEVKYFSEERAKELFNPLYIAEPLSDTDSVFGSMKGRNIVLLVLESFASEHTGFYNKNIDNYPSYTPFIDSIASESYTFEYGYANGRVSVQAMPSALVSLPSMGFRFVNSYYTNNSLLGMSEILKKDGYKSTFYHGGINGSMGFDAFTKSIGFDRYFGKTEYNNDADYDGLWGIFDEPFLQRVALEISKEKKPSLSTIFTLSSHTPYTLPDKYKDVFTSGSMPMHNVISYSDMAVRKFFNRLKELGVYDNSLFIIMADHCSVTSRSEYNNIAGKYRIPIIFFDPQGKIKGLQTDIIAQQADILPSLLYLLGDTTPIISYGNNLFDKNAPHFALERDSGIYYLITKDYTLRFDPTLDKYEILPPTLHTQASEERVKNWKHIPEYDNSIDTLKAIIQDYNYRLIHNKLLPEGK